MKHLAKAFFILAVAAALTAFLNETKAQSFTAARASYMFYDTSDINSMWYRTLSQSMTIDIDTVKRQLVIPNLQLWSNIATKRNLITGQIIATGDTTLSMLGNITFKMTGRPILHTFGLVMTINLQDNIYAVWWPDYLAITFPKWKDNFRLLEFEK